VKVKLKIRSLWRAHHCLYKSVEYSRTFAEYVAECRMECFD